MPKRIYVPPHRSKHGHVEGYWRKDPRNRRLVSRLTETSAVNDGYMREIEEAGFIGTEDPVLPQPTMFDPEPFTGQVIPEVEGWDQERTKYSWHERMQSAAFLGVITEKDIKENGQENVNEMFREMYDGKESLDYSKTHNGVKYTVKFGMVEEGGRRIYSDDSMREALATIDDLMVRRPIQPYDTLHPDGIEEVGISFDLPMDPKAPGSTVIAKGIMSVDMHLLQNFGSKETTKDRAGIWYADNADELTDLQYTLAHEWGHLATTAVEGNAVIQAMKDGAFLPPTGYARSAFKGDGVVGVLESIAESWAGWYANSVTADSDTRYLAQKLGWTRSPSEETFLQQVGESKRGNTERLASVVDGMATDIKAPSVSSYNYNGHTITITSPERWTFDVEIDGEPVSQAGATRRVDAYVKAKRIVDGVNHVDMPQRLDSIENEEMKQNKIKAPRPGTTALNLMRDIDTKVPGKKTPAKPSQAGRTDPHAKKNIVPEDYEMITPFYRGTSDDMLAEYESSNSRWEQALEDEPHFDGNFENKQTCDICGARFTYGVAYRHKPTGEIINIGHDCASNSLFPGATSVEHAKKLAAERTKSAKTEAANKIYRAEVLSENPELEEAFKTEHHIVEDIRRRFYGSKPQLSPKQIALVLKIAREERERAENPPEPEITSDVITGSKVPIQGKILSTKWQESQYGSTLKMLVRDDRGFKVWGSVPSKVLDSVNGSEDLKGRHVSFTAGTIDVSQDDSTFGFFKRPTKATLTDGDQEEGSAAKEAKDRENQQKLIENIERELQKARTELAYINQSGSTANPLTQVKQAQATIARRRKELLDELRASRANNGDSRGVLPYERTPGAGPSYIGEGSVRQEGSLQAWTCAVCGRQVVLAHNKHGKEYKVNISTGASESKYYVKADFHDDKKILADRDASQAADWAHDDIKDAWNAYTAWRDKFEDSNDFRPDAEKRAERQEWYEYLDSIEAQQTAAGIEHPIPWRDIIRMP
jgi:hypothetical protein